MNESGNCTMGAEEDGGALDKREVEICWFINKPEVFHNAEVLRSLERPLGQMFVVYEYLYC